MTSSRARVAAALLALLLGAWAERPAAPARARGVQVVGDFEALGAGVALRSANYQVMAAAGGVALRQRATLDERLATGRPTAGPEGPRPPVVLADPAAPLPRPEQRPAGLDDELLRPGRIPDDQPLRPG